VTNYIYDSEGNVVSEGDLNSVTTYIYDQVIPNTISLMPIFFRPFKQLPSKITYQAGGDQYNATHTYTFDEKNRVVTDKAVASNGDMVTKSFTYY
jgi:hypothetical protein